MKKLADHNFKSLAIILGAFFKRDFLIIISYKFQLIIQVIFFIFLSVFIYIAAISSNTEETIYKFIRYYFSFILMDFMFAFMGNLGRQIRENQLLGTFENIFISGVSFEVIIIYSYISTFIKFLFRFLLYLSIIILFTKTSISFESIMKLLYIFFISSFFFFSFGLLSSSFIIYFKQGNPINFIVFIISISLSGMFFPVENLFINASSVSAFIPTYFLLENYDAVLGLVDKNMIALTNYFNIYLSSFILLCIGYSFFKISLKISIKHGNLGHY